MRIRLIVMMSKCLAQILLKLTVTGNPLCAGGPRRRAKRMQHLLPCGGIPITLSGVVRRGPRAVMIVAEPYRLGRPPPFSRHQRIMIFSLILRVLWSCASGVLFLCLDTGIYYAPPRQEPHAANHQCDAEPFSSLLWEKLAMMTRTNLRQVSPTDAEASFPRVSIGSLLPPRVTREEACYVSVSEL